MSDKRILYVGGLEDCVTPAILRAAFQPFGDIKDVQIPMDYQAQSHRGFGFVEFEEVEDAEAAMDNMNEAELYGRVLRVNVARPMKIKLGSSKPVWAEADEWYQNKLREEGFQNDSEVKEKEKDVYDALNPIV